MRHPNQGTATVGRIVGVPIQVHYTWLFAIGLITWSLSVGFFPNQFRGWDVGTYWLVGVISAVALFASVLVHELSHSLLALARGLGVHSITLFIFGGVSRVSEEAEDPTDEFVIAAIGPLTSFALAVGFWVAQQLLRPGNTPLGAVLMYLTAINALLGAFNMMPGFPLDGGRVLRSVIWAVTGSLHRATTIASYFGQAIGLTLIVLGGAQILSGNFLGGLWIGLIGWFLNRGAESSRRQLVVREALHGLRVLDLMDRDLDIAGPDMSVHEFVVGHVVRRGKRALPVVENGRVLGIVSLTDAKELPPRDWVRTPVRAIMTRAPLKIVSPQADASHALSLLLEGDLNQLPVLTNDGRLVGLLTRSEILRVVQVRRELEVTELPRHGEEPRPAELKRVA